MSVDRLFLPKGEILREFFSVRVDVDPLIPLLKETLFTEGQILITQGGKKGPMIFIAGGSVRVEREISPGKVVHLADIKRGGLVGEMALVLNQPRSASVIAKEFGLGYLLDETGWKYIQENHGNAASEIEQWAKGRQKLLETLNLDIIF